MSYIFVDMDGVLADFDHHYYETFGVVANKTIDNVDWEKVKKTDKFYENIPPMHDFDVLWNYIRGYDPIILTGVPKYLYEEASENKKNWVKKHIGDHQRVICCQSKRKSDFCVYGDILIDDWEKYMDLWIKKGGIWITHTSAENSIAELKKLGY